jgi:hypothetical protein
METFRYHSNELKKTPNGVRSNVVTVKNGKGTKNTIIYNNSGKVVENVSKKLTISEIKNIKNSKFMPGLFKMRKRTRKLKR